ncbi:MAG: phosphodiesterase [Gemmatimonadota bacterium]|nr:phosphodiesterase [Gemmatimonadota bacterium]
MRIVQLSDPHIEAPARQPVLGRNTITQLQDAVHAVNTLSPVADFVILTGDQTNDESDDSFEKVKQVLGRLQMPCHLVLGNHDARTPFRRVMLGEDTPSSDRYYYTVKQNGYRFIILDTLDEGKVTGLMDKSQLDWLEAELAEKEDLYTVICMHHPPISVGVDWMDALILQEPERLLRIFDASPCLKLVLCGHVHHPVQIQHNELTILTAPAISVQFRKVPLPPPAEKPYALLTDAPPAFRIVDLNPEGWETTLHHLSS